MKKVISIVLSVVLLASVLFISFTADAAGWLSYARTVHLDEMFSDELTESGYYDEKSWYDEYYDVFKFTVPVKGKVNLRIECEENMVKYSNYYIYSSKNIDDSIWEGDSYWGNDKVAHGYSSGRGVYYDEWAISLSAGSYYLVVGSTDNYLNVTSDYILAFTPSFSNTSINSLSGKNNAFKVKWKRASGVDGYHIQYSLNKNMKSAKKVTVNKQSTVSKTVKKLRNKKKYYVRVRTYKKMKVEGVNHTYYGKWSTKKTVKTK